MARTPRSILIAVVLWTTILAGIAAIVRYTVMPMLDQKRQSQLNRQTGSYGRFQHEVILALDNFSGYCQLRSGDFANRLGDDGILLTLVDDGADYQQRLKALSEGTVDMAVFPLNSFLQTGAELSTYPASIVYIIDETQGADAIVADQTSIQNIQSLNRAEARIVVTPNSTSEFLARVLIASFNLPELPDANWMIAADGSGAIFDRFRDEAANRPYAYALWEPEVSKAKRDKDTVVLLDSSKVKGYIVDALVIRREFLIDHYPIAKTFVEQYARSVYHNQSDRVTTVLDDAKSLNIPLTTSDAENIVRGIAWKNTLENMAHFGLMANQGSHENIEAILHKISDVLVQTGALERKPLDGQFSTLYFDQILKDMQSENFHPSRSLNVIQGMDIAVDNETLNSTQELQALSETQWQSLIPVGELRVAPIQFGRGTARLSLQSKRELENLATLLQSWPQYYLIIHGQVRPGGDEQAALKLAESRANSALEVLAEQGIARQRMKATAAIAPADRAEAQSVSFRVGQLPY